MKKAIFLAVMAVIFATSVHAQNANDQQLHSAVTRLGNATNVKNYQQLENEFENIAEAQKTNWLPWYYAALCNARIGLLYQDDGDLIEPFAKKGDMQIKKALSLLDTASQKKELSEVYCVLSMVNRANVFINPMTYGRQYGPAASQYIQLARKVNPANPRAIYLEGWEKYATPKMWGGDKVKAKELFELAAKQLETQQVTDGYPHWGKKEVDDMLKKL
jgi:hypothetical protein